MQTNISEVARMRQYIATGYLSAQSGFSGSTEGTTRHRCITAKTERIGTLHQRLQALAGEHAIALIAEAVEVVPDTATQHDLSNILHHAQAP